MASKAQVNPHGFVPGVTLPYGLRTNDFFSAMDDIYVAIDSINSGLQSRGLLRIEESVRGANFTALLSDLMVVALSKHALGLTKNMYSNGHPDLIQPGQHPDNAAQAASHGVEVKVTRGRGPAVDAHGARGAWWCVFRYAVDSETQPIINRAPTRFTHIWLAQLTGADFRDNPRHTPLGTRTSSPNRQGATKLRAGLVYLDA